MQSGAPPPGPGRPGGEAVMSRTKPWHNPAGDLPKRQDVLKKILYLLQQRQRASQKPAATKEAMDKIQDMSTRLETALYFQAGSLEEYADSSTLTDRLKRVAVWMAGQKRAHEAAAAAGAPVAPPPPVAARAPAPPTTAATANGGYVDMSSVNRLLTSAATTPATGAPSAFTAPPASVAGTAAGAYGQVQVKPDPGWAGAPQAVPAGTVPALPGGAPAPAAGVPAGERPPMDPEQRKQFLRSQQQRLLLLRHASKCPAPIGTCTATPYCGAMKGLWPHLAQCKQNPCPVKHCVSSRYVLSHYHRCKKQCEVCTPVREAIAKHNAQMAAAAAEQARQAQLQQQPTRRPRRAATRKRNQDDDEDYEDEGEASPPTKRRVTQRKVIMKPPAPHNPRRAAPPVPMAGYGAAGGLTMVPAHAAQPPRRPEDPNALFHKNDTLCARMSLEDIKMHCRSLIDRFNAVHSPKVVADRCEPVLRMLLHLDHLQTFSVPVDPVMLGLDDYFDVIKRPMDLGTIKKKLDSNTYTTFNEFASDVRLVWSNAMLYNPPDQPVHIAAKSYAERFNAEYARVEKRWMSEVREAIKSGNPDTTCSLCGGEDLRFEPPAIFCLAPTCRARIRRNATYWTTDTKKYSWCPSCYKVLEDPVQVPDTSVYIPIKSLRKVKNDDSHKEWWVACDGCGRWQHQICALFNQRRHEAYENPSSGNARKYYCPICLMWAHRQAAEKGVAVKQAPMRQAADLDTHHLDKYLEQRLHQMILEHRESEASIRRVPLSEIPEVPQITLRLVAVTDKEFLVMPGMAERYKAAGYPQALPQRSKALMLFQRMDGVDIVIFGMYVQEYGSNCPPPNHRSAYLSYIDSIKYFQPPELRTPLFQEIIVSYLSHLKGRGFCQMMLWACPPSPGDDYIMYCHPDFQKTPKPERLRNWYLRLMETAKQRKIVDKIEFFKDAYFPDGKFGTGRYGALTQLPYYEGDYWPGFAEEFIPQIKGEGAGAPVSDDDDDDDEDYEDEDFMPSRSKPKTKRKTKGKRSGRSKRHRVPRVTLFNEVVPPDALRDKVDEMVTSMRTDFLIARLVPSCALCKRYIMGHGDDDKVMYSCAMCATEDGNPWDLCARCHARWHELPEEDRHAHPLTERPVVEVPRVTEDPDPPIDSPFFETRVKFLNLCQGNRYQFDQPRRAKHSTSMVLYHAHNPTAPAFRHTCDSCNQDIMTGTRWECATCGEYDLCDRCKQTAAHPHPLKPFSVVGTGEEDDEDGGGGPQSSQLMEMAKRKRSIQLHMKLLVHAAECHKPDCPSANCTRMKSLLQHGSTCTVKATGGCAICRRIWALLQIHARQCTAADGTCSVPRCADLKQHLRRVRLAEQQKAYQMDARRRAYATGLHSAPPPAAAGTKTDGASAAAAAGAGTAPPPSTGGMVPGHGKKGSKGVAPVPGAVVPPAAAVPPPVAGAGVAAAAGVPPATQAAPPAKAVLPLDEVQARVEAKLAAATDPAERRAAEAQAQKLRLLRTIMERLQQQAAAAGKSYTSQQLQAKAMELMKMRLASQQRQQQQQMALAQQAAAAAAAAGSGATVVHPGMAMVPASTPPLSMPPVSMPPVSMATGGQVLPPPPLSVAAVPPIGGLPTGSPPPDLFPGLDMNSSL